MYHPSKTHLLDTMFVIVCVIAGATSHNISNTSKSSINQLNNHYRASFMDFILDARLYELLQTSNTINKNSESKLSTDRKSTSTKLHQQPQTVCSMLSNLLLSNQMKFCIKHQDILERALPQVVQLTKVECARITMDLRWNCSSLGILLDRSNPLAFTKEAALVRSILNASMMYIVARLCSQYSYRSCGCLNGYHSAPLYRPINYSTEALDRPVGLSGPNQDQIIDHHDLSELDLLKLESGLPLRLMQPSAIRQDCRASLAFADAFTKLFIDSDETKSLNKANKILNDGHHLTGDKSSSSKRLIDSDYKDFAYIKWTKSAVNLHNNHVGRQMVREATQIRCRCHGLSGVCQFRTCWEQLLDFREVTSRLRASYLSDVTLVEMSNLGSYENPDLQLARVPTGNPELKARKHEQLSTPGGNARPRSSSFKFQTMMDAGQFRPTELIYLYDSPAYCEPQTSLGHFGTKGRACLPLSNLTSILGDLSKTPRRADSTEDGGIELMQNGRSDAPGSCEYLCCDRGYHSELVLGMVTCDCRFRFCCKLDCEYCLKQKLQYHCL